MLQAVRRIGLVLCFVIIALVAASLSLPESGRAATVRPTQAISGITLRPSISYQRRTFRVPEHSAACRPLVQAHPNVAGHGCFLVVGVELRGAGVHPIRTGGQMLAGQHVQTGYAAITLCLSAPTAVARGDCYRRVQGCPATEAGPLPACFPS